LAPKLKSQTIFAIVSSTGKSWCSIFCQKSMSFCHTFILIRSQCIYRSFCLTFILSTGHFIKGQTQKSGYFEIISLSFWCLVFWSIVIVSTVHFIKQFILSKSHSENARLKSQEILKFVSSTGQSWCSVFCQKALHLLVI
jgi:hypothetical protein